MDPKLSQIHLAIIEQEEKLLSRILEAIAKKTSQAQVDRVAISNRLLSLRDEAAHAREDDLPTLFDQLHTQRALFEHSSDTGFPDPRSPYFAHLELIEGEKTRQILLGHKSFLEVSGLPIIDWCNAPISRIFFNYREGDEFEEQLPGRLAEGTVGIRRILSIQDGQLIRILCPDFSLSKNNQGQWFKDDQSFIPNLKGGAGSAMRSQHLLGSGQTKLASPEVSALLDPLQFELLQAESDEPLLILGGAGCGKTTVALHRMAVLHFRDPKRFSQQKMLVIVPEPGLVRLSTRLLASLGLTQIQVISYDDWIENQARKLIKGLPKKVCDEYISDVSKYKRHKALRKVFPLIVEEQVKLAKRKLSEDLAISRKFLHLLDQTKKPMLLRLAALEEHLLAELKSDTSSVGKQKRRHASEYLESLRKNWMDINQDRLELFANPSIIDKVIEESQGELTEKSKQHILNHSREQLASNTRSEFSGFDSTRLETIDGSSLKDQDDSSVLNTIDAEDFAILIELLVYKLGSSHPYLNKISSYAHLVLDEAQDLSPIELNALGRAINMQTAVTIAGDAAQQINPSTSFESWEQVLNELGLKKVHANHLKTSYRSTKPIAEFAHKVLGHLAPEHPPKAIRDGLEVSISETENDGQVSLFLNEALDSLMSNEPHANVAVICKTQDFAIKLARALKDVSKVRLIEDGNFEFRPGIEITTVDQVKGLEFDYVIIPDAGQFFYKDNDEDRRLMHVAATRAIHQLWVLSVGKLSPIVGKA